MKNRNNDDEARANFMARHRCSEKKDKSKVCPTQHSSGILANVLTVLLLYAGWVLGLQVQRQRHHHRLIFASS